MHRVLQRADDAIVAVDSESLVVYWNRGAERMLGVSAAEALGRPHDEVFHWHWPEWVETCGAHEALKQDGSWRGECSIVTRSGSELQVEVTLECLGGPARNPPGWLAVIRDIGERRRAETQRAAAQTALEHYSRQLEILHDIDRAVLAAHSVEEIARSAIPHIRKIIPAAHASLAVFDRPAGRARVVAVDSERPTITVGTDLPLAVYEPLISRGEPECVLVEDLAAVRPLPEGAAALVNAGIRGYAMLPLVADSQTIGSLSLGSWAQGSIQPEHLAFARRAADSLAVAIQNARLNDQIRGSRRQLRALSRRLAEVQEAERSYIAHQLYDDAGQGLAALALEMRVLEQHAEPGSSLQVRLGRLRGLVGHVLGDLHRLANHLRPASLDLIGLVAAVRQLADETAAKAGIGVTVEAWGMDDARLPQEVETCLYWIIQEALANAAQHASAGQVGVVLQRSERRVSVVVEDDGLGFALAEAVEHGGLGLFGMRERAAALGGCVDVESVPNGGTRVYVDIPC